MTNDLPGQTTERNNTISNHIAVLDAIMGSGKTMFVIDMLKKTHENNLRHSLRDEAYTHHKFIVVVPYLKEAERYLGACPGLSFRQPAKERGRKLNGLLSLVKQQANIVTTHSLFLDMTQEVSEAIRKAGYRLIVDETPQVLDLVNDLTGDDLDLLLAQRMVTIDPDSEHMRWDPQRQGYEGKFSEVKERCLDGYRVASGDKRVLFDLYPSAFFRAFDTVMVCTYLYRGGVFDAYCQSEGLAVEHMTLDADRTMVPYAGSDHEAKQKASLRQLITIYEGPSNKLGQPIGKSQPLSSSWFKKAKPEVLHSLKGATERWFDREARTCSADSGWTTYKAYESKLKGKGYSKGFISANARATNEYDHKAAMAFLCNWHEHPSIVRFFERKGIKVDEDQIALSTLLQWVWRSRIRQGQPIHLFVPSARMRTLLRVWLDERAEPVREAA